MYFSHMGWRPEFPEKPRFFKGIIKLACILLIAAWTVVLCRGAFRAWNNVIFCSLLVSQPNSAAVFTAAFFLPDFWLPHPNRDLYPVACCFYARNPHIENVEVPPTRFHFVVVSKKGCI